jgi:hypothetical protein
VYLSSEGRPASNAALLHLGADGSPGSPAWLTTDGTTAVHIAATPAGLVVGWRIGGSQDYGGTTYLQSFDGAGNALAAPTSVTATFRDHSDFFGLPDGSIGWVAPASDHLVVERYATCGH